MSKHSKKKHHNKKDHSSKKDKKCTIINIYIKDSTFIKDSKIASQGGQISGKYGINANQGGQINYKGGQNANQGGQIAKKGSKNKLYKYKVGDSQE